MYDVIVFGATFAAAGIAEKFKEKCLVLERRLQAGYEFYGALRYGAGYDKPLRRKEASDLFEKFQKNGTPYGNDTLIYPFFKQCTTLFGTEIVSVEKNGDAFLCTVHGVDGYKTFFSKAVVDTRFHAKYALSKTFNLLMESKDFPHFDGILAKAADSEGRFVLQVPVPLSFTFQEARKEALKIVGKFSSTQKLIYSANEFDYRASDNLSPEENGVRLFPSKAFKNPVQAFEGGLILGEEMKR